MTFTLLRESSIDRPSSQIKNELLVEFINILSPSSIRRDKICDTKIFVWNLTHHFTRSRHSLLLITSGILTDEWIKRQHFKVENNFDWFYEITLKTDVRKIFLALTIFRSLLRKEMKSLYMYFSFQKHNLFSEKNLKFELVIIQGNKTWKRQVFSIETFVCLVICTTWFTNRKEGFYKDLQHQKILEFKMSLIWTKNLNSHLDNISSSLLFAFKFVALALALIFTRSFTFIWRWIMRVGVCVQNVMQLSPKSSFSFS